MRTLDENRFFNKLFNGDKHSLQIEDRIGNGYRTYGIPNHAEFNDYMNPHDNCLWDAIIPGYDYTFTPDRKYKMKSIIGALILSDGNHKIAVKVQKPGYSAVKAKKDINTYVNNYLSSYLARKKNSNGKWVQFEGF